MEIYLTLTYEISGENVACFTVVCFRSLLKTASLTTRTNPAGVDPDMTFGASGGIVPKFAYLQGFIDTNCLTKRVDFALFFS